MCFVSRSIRSCGHAVDQPTIGRTCPAFERTGSCFDLTTQNIEIVNYYCDDCATQTGLWAGTRSPTMPATPARRPAAVEAAMSPRPIGTIPRQIQPRSTGPVQTVNPRQLRDQFHVKMPVEPKGQYTLAEVLAMPRIDDDLKQMLRDVPLDAYTPDFVNDLHVYSNFIHRAETFETPSLDDTAREFLTDEGQRAYFEGPDSGVSAARPLPRLLPTFGRPGALLPPATFPTLLHLVETLDWLRLPLLRQPTTVPAPTFAALPASDFANTYQDTAEDWITCRAHGGTCCGSSFGHHLPTVIEHHSPAPSARGLASAASTSASTPPLFATPARSRNASRATDMSPPAIPSRRAASSSAGSPRTPKRGRLMVRALQMDGNFQAAENNPTTDNPTTNSPGSRRSTRVPRPSLKLRE